MSKHQRAFQEKQRAKERLKKKIVTGTTAAALTAAALVGYNAVKDSEASKPNIPVTTMDHSVPEKQYPHMDMEDGLKSLLKAISTPDSPVENIIGAPYKELTKFKVNNHNIRIIGVGDYASTSVADQELRTYKHDFELFGKFAASNAQFKVPVAEVGAEDRITSMREAKASVEPLNKDVVTFLVPLNINIGNYMGHPNTFTDTQQEVVVSFFRPDKHNGDEGRITEACQAMMNVVLDNKNDFNDVAPDHQEKITLLTQEEVCNPLAKAIYYSRNKSSFENYKIAHSKQVIGWTQRPTSTTSAFASTMPYIDNPQIYSQISSNIPPNVGDSFVYPPIVS